MAESDRVHAKPPKRRTNTNRCKLNCLEELADSINRVVNRVMLISQHYICLLLYACVLQYCLKRNCYRGNGQNFIFNLLRETAQEKFDEKVGELSKLLLRSNYVKYQPCCIHNRPCDAVVPLAPLYTKQQKSFPMQLSELS